jgi:phosphoglycerate dehydrogenase-like enzyme
MGDSVSEIAGRVVLAPEAVADEVRENVAAFAPELRVVSYAEVGDAPEGLSEAVAVLRWIAGKRYERFIVETPGIRWLHTASAGVDHVLTPGLRAEFATGRDLTLTDSGPAFTVAIGEFVLAWMLSLAHELPGHREAQGRKEWKWRTHEELHGRTVGIVGLGPIGHGVAERCQAFGMRTLGLRRRPEPVPGVDAVYTGADGLNVLLSESDWLVLAAASTPETRSLIGAGELARMKPTARLINVARGALVDEPALTDALRNGTIAAACLDVFAREPLPPESPLWDLPNCYVTPHNAPGWSADLRRRQLGLFYDNLRRLRAGEPLEGVVDIERGY